MKISDNNITANNQDGHIPVRDIMPSHSQQSHQADFDYDERLKPVRFLERFRRTPDFNIVKSQKLKFIVFGVLFYAAFIFVIDQFSRSIVTVSLRSAEIDVNTSLAVGSKAGEPAEIAVLEDEMAGRALTSQIKMFREGASGPLTIYNAYSSSDQALVAGTRFENPDGKIYRLKKAIIVPGAKIVDGNIEPSSIEAEVAAGEAGEAYNIGPSDFTIPGFKGSVKYEKFYAKSRSAINGGFSGQAKVVSEKDIESLKTSLENELRQKLARETESELPDGFFVPDGAVRYEISIKNIDPPAASRADEFKMTVSGKATALFARKKDIESKMLSILFADKNFEGASISNFEELKFSAANLNFSEQTMNLKISGKARVVWNVDVQELANALASASGDKERFDIFSKYSQIQEASIAYRPSWWKIFRRSADKINIIQMY